jgi:hypothetical protein
MTRWISIEIQQGLAVIDTDHSSEKVIRHLPITSLSVIAKERFRQLFDFKSCWTLPSIQPYLR